MDKQNVLQVHMSLWKTHIWVRERHTYDFYNFVYHWRADIRWSCLNGQAARAAGTCEFVKDTYLSSQLPLDKYIVVQVYMYLCMCVCVYEFVYMYLCICICVYVFVYTCLCTCVCVYVFVCAYMCLCICTCVYAFFVYVFVCMCICVYVHVYVYIRVHM